MDDAERIDTFLLKYAGRMDSWRSLVLGADSAGWPDDSRPERRHPGPAIPPFDPRHAEQVLSDLLEDLHVSSEDETPDLARVRRQFVAGDLSASRLLEAARSRDPAEFAELGERAGVAPEVLQFLGTYLARPFLAASAGKGDEQGTGTGSCPVCGGPPAVTFLMPKEGRRRAWCRTCGHEWNVERIRCLGCGNTDTATLGYFTLGEDATRRVDFCRRCGRYVKTVDLRKTGGESDPIRGDRADLTTGDLDMAAAREGFIPVGPKPVQRIEPGSS